MLSQLSRELRGGGALALRPVLARLCSSSCRLLWEKHPPATVPTWAAEVTWVPSPQAAPSPRLAKGPLAGPLPFPLASSLWLWACSLRGKALDASKQL